MENIEHLQEKILKIKSAKTLILGNWSRSMTVQEILKSHNIEMEVFIVTYANDIFEYYIGVVEGKNVIGDCPVMSSFLDYLKENKIKYSELFLICTNFRRAMLDELFDQNELNKMLFDEISYVFDQNFSGVIDEYHSRHKGQD